jgi:hypothetical protein
MEVPAASDAPKVHHDIKETLEAIEALGALGVPVKKALKDGKLNVSDLQFVGELLDSHKVIVEGALGLDKILPEVKDIDSTELALIGAKAIEVLRKIKEA